MTTNYIESTDLGELFIIIAVYSDLKKLGFAISNQDESPYGLRWLIRDKSNHRIGYWYETLRYARISKIVFDRFAFSYSAIGIDTNSIAIPDFTRFVDVNSLSDIAALGLVTDNGQNKYSISDYPRILIQTTAGHSVGVFYPFNSFGRISVESFEQLGLDRSVIGSTSFVSCSLCGKPVIADSPLCVECEALENPSFVGHIGHTATVDDLLSFAVPNSAGDLFTVVPVDFKRLRAVLDSLPYWLRACPYQLSPVERRAFFDNSLAFIKREFNLTDTLAKNYFWNAEQKLHQLGLL